jgi:putative redox protein
MDLRLTLPREFPSERTAALLAVVEHCTVHNTLMQPPGISIRIGPP